MLRSMSSAISGLRNHQTYMDVVGHNISNVNTVGFKASRVNFKEALAQTSSTGSAPVTDGATPPNYLAGGTNPVQVGLGVVLGGIDSIMTQGPIIPTGKNTDLAIQGDGFFVLGNTYDSVNFVASPAYYSRGGAFALDRDGYLVDPVSGQYVLGVRFERDANGPTTPLTRDVVGGSARLDRIRIDPAWGWSTFSIGADGKITGVLSDGSTDTTVAHTLQLALAKFSNPDGLLRAEYGLFRSGPNSGTPLYGPPNNVDPASGATGVGMLMAGALENSNVDLAEQFSRMIMAERGFQANSRIISASDEMLMDLVNMKR